jgi:hypothetical protein
VDIWPVKQRTLDQLAADDWPRAMRACALTHRRIATRSRVTGQVEPVESMPRIRRLRALSNGVVAGFLRAAEGTHISEVMARSDRIAASLGVHNIHIEPVDHATGNIYLIPTDPWPNVRRWAPTDPTNPRIEFATDQLGRRLSVPLVNVGFLIAASKGGGKSVLEFTLAAGAACRQNVILLGVDPKGTELQFFDKRFSLIVDNPTDLPPLLKAIEVEMAHRYRRLKTLRRKQVDRPTEQFPAVVLVVDELRYVVDKAIPGGWRAHADEALAAFNLFAFLGRAAAISLIAATQHPHYSIVPTTLRSNLLNRWCGITEGRTHAAVVIGDDAARGYFQREGAAALPLVLVDFLDEKGADLVDETTAGLRPEHAAFDALRNAGTFNPVVMETVPAETPAEVVARLAGINPNAITDADTAITAIRAAALGVADDPDAAAELEAAAEALRTLYAP